MLKKSFFIVLLILFSLFKTSYASIIYDDYIEIKKFCREYNYILYVHFKKDTLVLKQNETSINLLIGSDIVIKEKEVYFLNRPIIKQKGNIYLPRSILKILLNESKKTKEYNGKEYGTKDIISKTKVSLPKAKDRNKKIDFILIDPGHGGKDPGNVNNNIIEKELNLIMSKKLYSSLKKQLPITKIYMTRTSDIFLSLDKRAEKAMSLTNLNYNGLFISLHANASLNPKTKGIETFFYSTGRTKINKSGKEQRLFSFKELTKPLAKHSRTNNAIALLYNLSISKESKMFAEYINNAVYKKIKNDTLNRGTKNNKAYFVVTNSVMPAILVEIGFLSNKEEAENLSRTSYQNKIIEGLVDGITQFIKDFASL